jgi:hypothetical protein
VAASGSIQCGHSSTTANRRRLHGELSILLSPIHLPHVTFTQDYFRQRVPIECLSESHMYVAQRYHTDVVSDRIRGDTPGSRVLRRVHMMTRFTLLKERKQRAILIDRDGRYYRWHKHFSSDASVTRDQRRGPKPVLNGGLPKEFRSH